MKKIAFLFLLYDCINHEKIWHSFFQSVNKSRYSIFIYSKYDVPLQYFEEYKCREKIHTAYADISIVIMQNRLLELALKDPENQHFIFVSNSCIPLKSFHHIYEYLHIDRSYFNISPQEQCFSNCNHLLQYIDKKYIQKSSQWCILNRKHAQLILTSNLNYHWYSRIYAPDEIFYITTLFCHEKQHEIIMTHHEPDTPTTFVYWSNMKYPFPKHFSGLYTYHSINDDELSYLLHSKCLFGRKFHPDCQFPSFYWNSISLEKV